MKLVQQITPFTCGLACIESLSTDLRKCITQTQILVKYKTNLLQGIPKIEVFGATTDQHLEFILKDIGFTPHKLISNDLATVKAEFIKNKNCLITAEITQGNVHTLRVIDFDGIDTLRLMDPGFFQITPQIVKMSLSRLITLNFYMIFVT